MRTFKINLVKKESIAYKTTAFFFTKPTNLTFKAGDYGKFTLINPPKTDLKGDTRSYSFASIPSEEFLMIATRMRNSAFKQVLDSLQPGSELSLLAPITMFNLPKKADKSLVFLTGGIGAAAARPMILDALENNFSNQIYLFNSNRHQKDIPFFAEFQNLVKKHSNFNYIPNITKKDSVWTEEKSYLTPEKLKKYLTNPTSAIFYLAGPPGFIWAMYKILQELGIKNSQIQFDEFTGY